MKKLIVLVLLMIQQTLAIASPSSYWVEDGHIVMRVTDGNLERQASVVQVSTDLKTWLSGPIYTTTTTLGATRIVRDNLTGKNKFIRWYKAPDTNGNSIPDDWEWENGLALNADESMDDFNEDGVTNLQHFQAGSSPIAMLDRADPDNGYPTPALPTLRKAVRLDRTHVRIDYEAIFSSPTNKLHILRAKDQDAWAEVKVVLSGDRGSWIDPDAPANHRYRYTLVLEGDMGNGAEVGNSAVETVVDDVKITLNMTAWYYPNTDPFPALPTGNTAISPWIPETGSPAVPSLQFVWTGPLNPRSVGNFGGSITSKIGYIPRGEEITASGFWQGNSTWDYIYPSIAVDTSITLDPYFTLTMNASGQLHTLNQTKFKTHIGEFSGENGKGWDNATNPNYIMIPSEGKTKLLWTSNRDTGIIPNDNQTTIEPTTIQPGMTGEINVHLITSGVLDLNSSALPSVKLKADIRPKATVKVTIYRVYCSVNTTKRQDLPDLAVAKEVNDALDECFLNEANIKVTADLGEDIIWPISEDKDGDQRIDIVLENKLFVDKAKADAADYSIFICTSGSWGTKFQQSGKWKPGGAVYNTPDGLVSGGGTALPQLKIIFIDKGHRSSSEQYGNLIAHETGHCMGLNHPFLTTAATSGLVIPDVLNTRLMGYGNENTILLRYKERQIMHDEVDK
jgi:hypothetical protein